MLPVSQKYKQHVYTRDYARHFAPRILLKVIDPIATQYATYHTEDMLPPYANLSQLIDENLDGSFVYGTMEEMQFNLRGHKMLMPSPWPATGQYGYTPTRVSDINGHFVPSLCLTCDYSVDITTAGRTLVFDRNYDSVPMMYTIKYYKGEQLLASDDMFAAPGYIHTSRLGVANYDRVKIYIHATSKPFRRVHLVEDIPGVLLEYAENKVVSINASQTIDVLSQTVTTDEVDFTVENADKLLDILNDQGFERYLQRRQPVTIELDMVYPDTTRETILIGNFRLVDWKTQKGALTASFTVRDELDMLSQSEYHKGVIPSAPVSLYDLAESVFEDAGVVKYKIDIQLLNIYTQAPLPIATHKELLRLIAQASRSIVITEADGTIRLKHISVLTGAVNTVQNPAFNADFNNWIYQYDIWPPCTLDTTQVYVGKQSVSVPVYGLLRQTLTTVIGHKYYLQVYVKPTGLIKDGIAGLGFEGILVSTDLAQANLRTDTWTRISALVISDKTNSVIDFWNGTIYASINVDCFMALDLTATYGAGNEPTWEWCDRNLRFFETTLLVPKNIDPPSQDVLDYTVLLESPEIATTVPVKSIETNIYSYKEEDAVTEIYKGNRYVNGTQDFIIQYTAFCKNPTIAVYSLDQYGEHTPVNTAQLIKSTIWSKAAEITVVANSDVEIVVQGKAIRSQYSAYVVDSYLDSNLVADATTVKIDNPLVASQIVAEDVTSYAAYWYARRYAYDFDWRQNPAIENTDWVTVYDDFNKNNTIMLTERNIKYNDGVLGGDSKGVY